MAKPGSRIDPNEHVQSLTDVWQVNTCGSHRLIAKIPIDGYSEIPAGSRGLTVAEQLLHVYKNRLVWVGCNRTRKRPFFSPIINAMANRRELTQAFRSSGEVVKCFMGNVRAVRRRFPYSKSG